MPSPSCICPPRFVACGAQSGATLAVKEPIYEMVKYVVLGLCGVAILFFIIAIGNYNKKLNDAELVEVALENSEYSIKVISKEEEMILNPRYKTYEDSTLKNLDIYHKNRKIDLAKIKKIANRKSTVSSFLLNFGTLLAIIPILEFGLAFILEMFGIAPYIYYIGLGVSLVSIVATALHFLFLIIFRKKNVAYYLVYLYVAVVVALSIFMK